MRIGFCTLLVITCFFYHKGALGQPKKLTYQLQGIVNRDTGTVTLLPISGQQYDPNLNNNYQTRISHGRFSLAGKMAYPGSYLLQISSDYVSSDFLLEPGNQTITCNADSLRETPQLATSTMNEYHRFITDWIQPIDKQRAQAFQQYLNQKSAITSPNGLDSLQTTFSQNRARLIHQQHLKCLAYIQQHPDSYVALWHLVKEMKNGYQPVLDSLYNAFSASLKNTPTGKTLAQRLGSSRITALGQIFPSLTLLNTSNQPISVTVAPGSKYTLIDFWFSRCGPCLQEFPKLKELFSAYQDKGFRIVGISIDKPVDKKIWQQTIQEKDLVWPQYLDLSGKLTVGQLSINYFPSNFLLDEKGRIIRKNISPSDLNNFLSQQM